MEHRLDLTSDTGMGHSKQNEAILTGISRIYHLEFLDSSLEVFACKAIEFVVGQMIPRPTVEFLSARQVWCSGLFTARLWETN